MNYKEVKIGQQKWHAENLHDINFRNGDQIYQALCIEHLQYACDSGIPAWHFPDFDKEKEYLGLYYNSVALLDKRGIGPEEWILPNYSDWVHLIKFTGYVFPKENDFMWVTEGDKFKQRKELNDAALSTLKAKKGWKPGTHKGNNEIGFNAISEKNGTFARWCYKKDTQIGWIHIGSVPKWPIEVAFDSYIGQNSFEDYSMLSHQVRLIHKDKISLIENESPDVIIGKQTWMIKNLDVTHFRNGDEIEYADDSNRWNVLTCERKPAWCWYNHEPEIVNGKLYNYFAVKDKRGIAPEGYFVPGKKDFEILFKSVGCSLNEGQDNEQSVLALMNSDGWNQVFENGLKIPGTNSSGFNALPSGCRLQEYVTSWEGESLYSYQHFGWKGESAFFWSKDSYQIKIFYDVQNKAQFDIKKDNYTGQGFSIRCLKGNLQ